MGKAKRFNSYDSAVVEKRKIIQSYGEARQKLSIGSSVRSSPLSPPIAAAVVSADTTAEASFPLDYSIDDQGNKGGVTVTHDLSLETAHQLKFTATGAITIAFSNIPSSGTGIDWYVKITQDGTGGHAITWPGAVAPDPGLSTTASTTSLVSLHTEDGGTVIDAIALINAAPTMGTFATIELDNLGTTSINAALLPSATNTRDLGSSGLQWKDLFVTGVGTIDTVLPNASATTDIGSSGAYYDRINARGIQFRGNDLSAPNASSVNQIKTTASTMSFNLDDTTHSYQLYFNGVSFYAFTDDALSTSTDIILGDGTDGGILQFNDTAADPISNGHLQRNSTDLKVFSGGAVRNLSDIGVAAGGADVFLSNLSSPTTVNQDLIPQAGKKLGTSGTVWSQVHGDNLFFGTAGVIGATSLQIFGDTGGMTFNIPAASSDTYDFQAGGVSKVSINDSGTITVPNIILSSILSINDITAFSGSNGQMYREGNNVKIFSGGVERNVSDIGTGSFLPLGGGTMSGSINMGSNDLTALDDIFFSPTDTEITNAAGIMSIRVGTSDTIRLRRGTTSGFIYDGNGFKFGTSLNIGVFGSTPVAKQTITGSRGGNAALASLLTGLANIGWITDSTTA